MDEITQTFRNPIDSFGKAQEFVLAHFNLFNGILNPCMPAYSIVFEQHPDTKVSGDNLGDVVNLNLLNIFNDYYSDNRVYNDYEFKGYLIYVLFHELIHLDQDLRYYYDKYREETTAVGKIEDSCHALTFLTMIDYGKTLENVNKDYFYIPSLSSFIHPRKVQKMENEGRVEDLYNYAIELSQKFVRIQSPLQKVLWLVAHGLYGKDYLMFYDVCNRYMNISLEIIVNGNLYTSGYIKVLGQFVNWRMIMDLYRIVILFSKQFKTNKVYGKDNIMETSISYIHVDFAEGSEDKDYAKYIYYIDGNLDVAYRN